MKTSILHPHRAVPLEPHQGHPVPSWSPLGPPNGLPKSQGFLGNLLEASWELLRALWRSPRGHLEHQNVQFYVCFAAFSNVCSFVCFRPCPPQSCSRSGKATLLRSNKQQHRVCSSVCFKPCPTKSCSRSGKATPLRSNKQQHGVCSFVCFWRCPSQQPAACGQRPAAISPEPSSASQHHIGQITRPGGMRGAFA